MVTPTNGQINGWNVPFSFDGFSGDNPTTVTFTLDADLTGIKKALMASMVQKTMDNETAALDRAKDLLEARP